MPLKKSFETEIKSAEDESGVVEAIVSAYTTDRVGDRVMPGAFTKSLARWKASGTNIPFIWSHQHDNPDAFLGEVIDAKETDAGLWVKARFDMDHPPARRVFDLLKARRVKSFSFAYEVKNGKPVQTKNEDGSAGESYYALEELDIFEAGPTLIPANPDTQLLGVKRAEFMDADVEIIVCAECSKKLLPGSGVGVPVALTEDETTDAKDEEPEAKSEELKRFSPSSALLLIDMEEMSYEA